MSQSDPPTPIQPVVAPSNQFDVYIMTSPTVKGARVASAATEPEAVTLAAACFVARQNYIRDLSFFLAVYATSTDTQVAFIGPAGAT